VRPRDAATLIIIRDHSEVLLGVRNAKHVFMPHRYVFPGGRVDAGDARVHCPFNLPATEEKKLLQSVSVPRARALAMAAVRETFEETGLILGYQQDDPPRSRSLHWRPFFSAGYVPALDRLHYFARAITPPGMVRRFDARFFIADARHVHGKLEGNGELGDLRWVPLTEVEDYPLAPITQLVLGLLTQHLVPSAAKTTEAALYRELAGKELMELHWPGVVQ
jgi:8-oxo-dGTP pyrophosphatase MutT (NUDIX family)